MRVVHVVAVVSLWEFETTFLLLERVFVSLELNGLLFVLCAVSTTLPPPPHSSFAAAATAATAPAPACWVVRRAKPCRHGWVGHLG